MGSGDRLVIINVEFPVFSGSSTGSMTAFGQVPPERYFLILEVRFQISDV
jgi:hypothetical protein